jgi:hypothetical protein
LIQDVLVELIKTQLKTQTTHNNTKNIELKKKPQNELFNPTRNFAKLEKKISKRLNRNPS